MSVSFALAPWTFGEQNTEAEGHEQISYALDRDVNFIDTAENVCGTTASRKPMDGPKKSSAHGLRKNGRRDEFCFSPQKVTGPSAMFKYVRSEINESHALLDRKKHFSQPVDASLKRFKDRLYRSLPNPLACPCHQTIFGQLGYVHKPENDSIPIEETMAAMDELVKAGKVASYRPFKRKPHGVCWEYIRQSEQNGMPRPQSIQKPL